MSLLRNPFAIPFVVAFIASVVALIVSLSITFSDWNDAAIPDSVWGPPHSYEFNNFVRQRTSGTVSSLEKQVDRSFYDIDDFVGIQQPSDVTPPSPPALPPGITGGY